jgi:hypothetical protein
MKHLLTLTAGACHDFAVLYVAVVLVPAILAPASGPGPFGSDGVLLVALGVISIALFVDAVRAARTVRGLVGCLATLVPRRGVIGRWYHLAFREPLTDPDQAREALAHLFGYRLRGRDYRIVSLRPAWRRWRIGILVTVERPSTLCRSWTCQYVRRVEDPHELWLLRSALRPHAGAEIKPADPPSPEQPRRLEALSGAELDRLLGPRGPARPAPDEPSS